MTRMGVPRSGLDVGGSTLGHLRDLCFRICPAIAVHLQQLSEFENRAQFPAYSGIAVHVTKITWE